MRNKISPFFFLFLAFALNFLFLKTTFAVSDNEVLAPKEVESVEIPLAEKLILKDGTPVQDVFNSTDDMINLIVKVVFIGAGFVLFALIVGAGFSMIQGSAKDTKDAEKAKTTMTSAIIGFIIMFAAYWIMQIIQLLTGINMGF